jgi:hypothetical protein
MLFVKDVMDKRNVDSLGTSFSSVYEFRLLPESYIYQMPEHLYHKRMLLDNPSAAATVKLELQRHNKAIENIISPFKKTKLTTAESAHLVHLNTTWKKRLK